MSEKQYWVVPPRVEPVFGYGGIVGVREDDNGDTYNVIIRVPFQSKEAARHFLANYLPKMQLTDPYKEV